MHSKIVRPDRRSEGNWNGEILAMTGWNSEVTVPQLSVSLDGASAPPEIYLPGSIIYGLRERECCIFTVLDAVPSQVFVDDVEVYANKDGLYQWIPSFLSGTVQLAVVVSEAAEFVFHVHIGSSEKKLSDAQYEAMVSEIRCFRASLLLDNSGATLGFDEETSASKLDALVRLARINAYAPLFLRQLQPITDAPHRTLQQSTRPILLSQAKRLHSSALREPRIAAIAMDATKHSEFIDTMYVTSPVVSPTFDTPSNRALKSLIKRMLAQTTSLLAAVQEHKLGGDKQEQEQRRPRRERALQMILEKLKVFLLLEPFASAACTNASAGGLTQIATQPAYSGAYRSGTKALWLGTAGDNEQDQLPVRPTWGVYEAWCMVHLLARISQVFSGRLSRTTKRGIVTADESYVMQLDQHVRMEVHFQARFPAGDGNTAENRGWCLSGLRIPDVVIGIVSGEKCEFIVMDAKYRRHRDNVLEAMESAHIYHDALRVNRMRAAFCLLLLPAIADVPHLDNSAFLFEHGVGTVSEFSPGGAGVARCTNLIHGWATTVMHSLAKQVHVS
ncbi:DUF2357 domain-containing protein [Janthinobacterium sp. SUN137]|uniref:DUF2357 domain-containing protein n=1 Tax=Janthinobacterium sp. SUN137 TaxID=3014789 RepID=UPI0027137CCA|nr:DUF2357 domain-containing protein [Janthinobacterium sp. SUN137]MDO8040293.1 DUF2357 domain-containing protein [Janthinobacterium sp. SUN137]